MADISRSSPPGWKSVEWDPSRAQVGLPHAWHFAYLFGLAFDLDAAAAHHVRVIAHSQGHLNVLLDQQHRMTLLFELEDHFEEIEHQYRREAQRQLVKHQDFGLAHQ